MSRRSRALARIAGCALAGLSGPACAHGFGRLYNLPVPMWLYAWGAAFALVLSFLAAGYFARVADASAPARGRDVSDSRLVRALRGYKRQLQGLALLMLLLCIATGFFGSRDPYRNFSMTFFWVVFLLGFTYLVALVGDFYAPLNPWRTLARLVERVVPGFTRGRFAYPSALGDWPALALYLAFVWIELFGGGKPPTLAAMLSAYTVINLAGVALVGEAAWFRHGEFLGVYLRHVGRLAPVDCQTSAQGTRVQLRPPLSGLERERPVQLSSVVFVLAMLATTAFDGLRATQWWVGLFWRDPTGLVAALAGKAPILDYPRLRAWYIGWESAWLLLAPFLYFAVYWLCLALMRRAARSERPLRELALDFAWSLLPIAFVYNVAHYFTLLLSQGLVVISLLSDPFGWGWNLFGTARLLRRPILPGMGFVWHAEVLLILAGHVIGIVVAHRIALRVLPEARRLRSQLPMLAFMVLLTVGGLWILAQPLTAELMR